MIQSDIAVWTTVVQNLYRRYVCLFVCLSWSMFRMAGQTAGPIETKLDTRTHVHPGSVSGKINVKVIHVCVRDWQKYETPGKRHLANGAQTTSGQRRRRHLANDYETPSNYSSSNEARCRHRAASAAGGSRTPSGGWVLTASSHIKYHINTEGHIHCSWSFQIWLSFFFTFDADI